MCLPQLEVRAATCGRSLRRIRRPGGPEQAGRYRDPTVDGPLGEPNLHPKVHIGEHGLISPGDRAAVHLPSRNLGPGRNFPGEAHRETRDRVRLLWQSLPGWNVAVQTWRGSSAGGSKSGICSLLLVSKIFCGTRGNVQFKKIIFHQFSKIHNQLVNQLQDLYVVSSVEERYHNWFLFTITFVD